MMSRYRTHYALAAVIVAAGCAAPVLAETMPLRAHHQGGIAYITGGVGDEELAAFRASARDYDLQITNSEKDGEFTAGTSLVVQAKGGQDVLVLRSTGPLVYAQLPPGEYTIHATFKGVERVQAATIAGKGATDIHLIWPTEE
jgi:hypothetical protein